MKPTVGRIVHFVLDEGKHAGEHRPAIVVRVWSDDLINIEVFTDGENDGYGQSLRDNIVWQTSVRRDDSHRPHTWHWPERE